MSGPRPRSGTARSRQAKKQVAAKKAFNPTRLASQVLVREEAMRQDFVAAMWAVADLLGDGLSRSTLGVTRYTQVMAEALQKSESYVDKYLRLSRVPPDKRIEATRDRATFTGVWSHLFPPRPHAESATAPEDEPDAKPGLEPEAAPRPEPRAATDAGSQPPHHAPREETGSMDPPPPARLPTDDDGDVRWLLTALEAPTVSGALTRVTQLQDQHQADRLEIERLKKRIEKAEGERDRLAFGSKIGQLFRELNATTVTEALARAKELNTHVLRK
jgi:hypothetical protein